MTVGEASRTLPGTAAGPVRPAGFGRLRHARHIAVRWPMVAVLAPVFLAGVAWTFLPPLAVALHAASHGRVFLGAAGLWPMDQLQYLAWARDAGSHGLISDLYGSGGRAVFVHPIWSLTGLAQSMFGFGDAAVLMFWQAVSLLVLLGGCMRFIWTRLGSSSPARRGAALAVCLFGGLTPLVAVLAQLDPSSASGNFKDATDSLLSGGSLWGYAPLSIAIGLMPWAIEALEALLTGRSSPRTLIRAAGLGALISWLHPWQGEELLVIGLGLAAASLRDCGIRSPLRTALARPRTLLAPVVAGVAILVPLAYYLLLSHIDPGWRTSAQASIAGSLIPWPVVITYLVPLALVVLIAARRTVLDRPGRVLVLWPAACLITVAVTQNGQYRALSGVAIPIGVLAVRAWPRVRSGRAHLAAVLALMATLGPATAYLAFTFRHLKDRTTVAYAEPAPSDLRAAVLAAELGAGRPILTPVALGTAVPALTDARVWVGHPIWTPEHLIRDAEAEQLFTGAFTPAVSRALVRTSRARALIEPCGYAGQLEHVLAPLGFSPRPVGCAVVYAR
ncbi:MAG: hypothetical protein ACYC91_11235 [Solirubrobacteraceae bacterium]